ncbi:uncharacterized [Tachysurus ichikawai]
MYANTQKDALARTQADLKNRSTLLTRVTSRSSEIPFKNFHLCKKKYKDKPTPRERVLSHCARGKVVRIVHDYKGKSSPGSTVGDSPDELHHF